MALPFSAVMAYIQKYLNEIDDEPIDDFVTSGAEPSDR